MTYPISQKAINILVKNYNPLDYSARLIELLGSVYPHQNFSNFSKYELHCKLNETILNNYCGEQILKYKLFQRYLNKRNYVAAFEIKVNNSRADFLTINGHTTSFEIKSELDNLSKFAKQASDYMMAFEYNYLVVSECHIEKAKQLLPDSFGLWCFKNGKHKEIKKANLNEKIISEVQLKLLSKRELTTAFSEVGGESKKILESFDAATINHRFKETLKDRYRSRWQFLVANQSIIFPIDLQFFFQTNILPDYIYYH